MYGDTYTKTGLFGVLLLRGIIVVVVVLAVVVCGVWRGVGNGREARRDIHVGHSISRGVWHVALVLGVSSASAHTITSCTSSSGTHSASASVLCCASSTLGAFCASGATDTTATTAA